MLSISVKELKEKMSSGEKLQLIDVREANEHKEFNIGGELIPLGNILQNVDKIATGMPVVFYCRKGIRSQLAIQRLQQKFSFTNLFNLFGGMDAWQKQFPV